MVLSSSDFFSVAPCLDLQVSGQLATFTNSKLHWDSSAILICVVAARNQRLGTDHQDHEWYNKSHEELLGSHLQLYVTDQDLTSKEMQDYQRSSS